MKIQINYLLPNGKTVRYQSKHLPRPGSKLTFEGKTYLVLDHHFHYRSKQDINNASYTRSNDEPVDHVDVSLLDE
jgi:carbonic anhydrase